MAVLQVEDGTIYSDIGAIANKLAALNVQIDRLAIDKTPAVQELLVQDLLNVTEKQQILAAFNSEFEMFKLTGGCQWCD